MKTDQNYMGEMFRIINGALRLDIDKVRNYTAFLADKLDGAGDKGSAERLRKMLVESDHQLRPTGSSFARSLPVDAESRFPLLERINLDALWDPPLILAQDQWDTVNEFLSISKSFAQVDAQDISASLSLLVYGPPGTGKSRLARYIAKDLGLAMYVARLDGLISSFLGSTSKNIRALFDFASKTPCVLFLDEFDAIAKLRGDTQELGELKRVVNSFIQNLDSLGNETIIIAATNHHELLDAAIWRRFSYRLELDFPDSDRRRQMWTDFRGAFACSQRDLEILVDLSDGFSGSDIQDALMRLQRRQKLNGQPFTLKEAFRILQNLGIGEGESRRFLSALRSKDERDTVGVLRNRNRKLYSHSVIADLLGVSKATACRWAQGEETGG